MWPIKSLTAVQIEIKKLINNEAIKCKAENSVSRPAL